MRVLLVEDDPMIGEAVEKALTAASYAVDWVRDGRTALEAADTQKYDLILLDLGLPRKDGLDVLRVWRDQGNPASVLIVTARDAVEARIEGLDRGADDYVLKPFEMGELLARMRAVARRRSGAPGPLLTGGGLTLDPATHEAEFKGRQVRLTGREFALLEALLVRPGAILSRGDLEDRLYGWDHEVESNAVEFLISSLRKKLGAGVIKNIRGVGWLVPKE